jgi:ABC-type transporter Mla MlaB component
VLTGGYLLRLTWIEDPMRGRYLRVEGRIVAPWSEVLETECLASLEAGDAREIDLSGTTHVDGGGFETLQRLVSRGFRVVGENPWISEIRRQGGW